MQHYSSTFLCHADFIPDRSCLDVPVGRKCSACNGLAPEFLHELQYLSEAFSSSLPLNCSKTPRPWRTRPCGQQMYENTNQVFVVFDGLHVEYCRRHYQKDFKDAMADKRLALKQCGARANLKDGCRTFRDVTL